MTDGLPAWLPPLVLLEAFGGDWKRYFAAVHRQYQADFGGTRPSFRGLRMGLKREPKVEGMEATFWHFVSEGHGESERTPDLRRCERIAWPMAIMQAVDTDKVCTWEEKDPKRGRKVLIALPDFSYLVVVDVRDGFVLPWTAYPVEQTNARTKLSRRYHAAQAAKKAGAASEETAP